MANRDKAVKMAARGATPKQIRQTTGVSGQAARNIVGRATAAAATGLRNPNKEKNHWTNADYGAKFGGKDIKTLSGKGFSNNEIMKIAQAAYAGGDVRNVNKLNARLGKLNQDFLNPDPTKPTANWGKKQPNKLFEWKGFGNGMTQYNKDGIIGLGGKYEKSQQWSLPTKFMGGFSPIPAANTGPATDAGASTVTGGAGAGGEGMLPQEPMMPMLPETPETTDTQVPFGVGADLANWAPGYKSKQSSRKRGGARTRTLSGATRVMPSSTTIGLQ